LNSQSVLLPLLVTKAMHCQVQRSFVPGSDEAFSLVVIDLISQTHASAPTHAQINAEEIRIPLRSDQAMVHATSSRVRRMFHHGRNIARLLSCPSVARVSTKNAHVCGARNLPTRNRRCLLALPDLAERERLSQAIARYGDVSGATGKDSFRLLAQITGPGGLLAASDHF
jgi:hypothetical protein